MTRQLILKKLKQEFQPIRRNYIFLQTEGTFKRNPNFIQKHIQGQDGKSGLIVLYLLHMC